MRIQFSIPGSAAEAIQIDAMEEMLRSAKKILDGDTPFKYKGRRAGKGYSYQVQCSANAARYILRDCEDRAAQRAGQEGFDQPASWQQGCRIAAIRIRRALKEAGA